MAATISERAEKHLNGATLKTCIVTGDSTLVGTWETGGKVIWTSIERNDGTVKSAEVSIDTTTAAGNITWGALEDGVTYHAVAYIEG